MNSYPHHKTPSEDWMHPPQIAMPPPRHPSLSGRNLNNNTYTSQHRAYHNHPAPPPSFPTHGRINDTTQHRAYPSQLEPSTSFPTHGGFNSTTPTNSEVDALLAYATYTSQPPPYTNLATLPMPLCLPQLTTGPTSLFVRGYSPVLGDVGITMEEWLHFVDGLNLAMASSPPLRVLDAAGAIIGIFPHWYFGVAGMGMQAVARVGMVTVAKTLSDRYLQRANATFFAPRGLRVRVCRTGAVHHLLGLQESEGSSSRGATKRAVQNMALQLPIVRNVYNKYASPVPNNAGPSTSYIDPNAIATVYPNDVTRRRLEALEGCALPLTFSNLPPAPSSGSLMERAKELSVKMEQKKSQEEATKMDRNRQLLAVVEGRADMNSIRSQFISASQSQSPNHELTKKEARQVRKLERKAWRAQKKMMKGKQPKSLQNKVQIADRIEYNATQDLLWVVVLTAEQDATIHGKEVLDDPSAVENIPEDEWNEELKEQAEEQKEYRDLKEAADRMHYY